MDRQAWILKTEPADFSWDDLVAEGESMWDGVRAGGAQRYMALMRPGDIALIYHTGQKRAVVGVARVTSLPYPDPTSSSGKHVAVDVEAGVPLPAPVTLAHIKASGRFPTWDLVRLPRLSVVPVSRAQLRAVLDWGGLARLPGADRDVSPPPGSQGP